MKFNSLHYALLTIVVLLAVYCGTLYFREGARATQGGKAAKLMDMRGELSSDAHDIKNLLGDAL